MSAPKATHTGTLFDGALDCYVLDNERRVVTNRGIVRALSGAKTGNLGQYLGRLPNKYAYLEAGTEIEFRSPTGMAKGHDAVWLVDLLKAYDEADDEGLLHPKQVPLARNSRRILRALAGVGIVALIDEATEYQKVREATALSFTYRAILLDSRTGWQLMHTPELADAMMRLHGKRYEGGSHPRELASTYHKLYVTVLGEEVVAELKRRNPEPSFGTNHHQWLTPEAKEVFRRQIPIVIALASTSDSKPDFWRRLEHHFKRQMLQISLPGAAE